MKNSNNYNGFSEYEQAIEFLEKGCDCGCSAKLQKKALWNFMKPFKLCPKQNKIFS